MISNERTYAILEGGSQVSFKQYTTTSVSNDTIQWSCPPPSPSIIVNRRVYVQIPVRLKFTTDAPVIGKKLISPMHDALRAFPIASSISNIAVTINNTTVTLNTSDVIHALLRYNTGQYLKTHEYSMTPSMLDQSQNYSDLAEGLRSPLQFYADSCDEGVEPRASFPMVVVENTENSAVIDTVLCEQLFLPPFYWGAGNMGGLINVQTLDFNVNFLGATANRMWSHDPDHPGAGGPITSSAFAFTNFTSLHPTNFQFSQAQPIIQFEYITPKELQTIPRSVTYPYFIIDRYPTPFGDIAPNESKIISSNNLQLNTIPRRLYIYCRPDNTVLYKNPNTPDCYAKINNISINWANQSGLLSSASSQQLYQISIKNHCNMTWSQWSGGPVYYGNSFTQKIGTVGSVLCIEFGTDIGLGDSECPGILGNYMLQIDVNVQNMNQTKTINYTLYIVTISEGVFTIENNRSIAQVGVVSKTDVLTAKQHMSDYVNYEDIQDVQGGNMMTGVKKYSQNLWQFLKPKLQAAYRIGKKAAPYISGALTAAKYVAPLLMAAGGGGAYAGGELVGGARVGGCQNCYGKGCTQCGQCYQQYGSSTVGGKMVSRDQLKQNLMRDY